jgi:hypothetical protein
VKVIDLLNKIAKGEEVPKKIRIGNNPDIFYYQEDIKSYKTEYNEYLISEWLNNSRRLNYEVEIIEEDKKIEKLDTDELFICDNHEHIYSNFINVYNKINEIIDKINKENI